MIRSRGVAVTNPLVTRPARAEQELIAWISWSPESPPSPACHRHALWLVVLAALVVLYAVTMENGAVLAGGARYLHEAFHDGRHLLGVSCH